MVSESGGKASLITPLFTDTGPVDSERLSRAIGELLALAPGPVNQIFEALVILASLIERSSSCGSSEQLTALIISEPSASRSADRAMARQ